MLSTAKNLGVTPQCVLYEMSYENATLYGYATPYYSYGDEQQWDSGLDANDPCNFGSLKGDEEIYVT